MKYHCALLQYFASTRVNKRPMSFYSLFSRLLRNAFRLAFNAGELTGKISNTKEQVGMRPY